jgi:hypothetical protein
MGAVVGAALGVLGLLLFGSPQDAVPAELIVGGAAVLAVLVTPVFELAYNYLRAPTLMLREDVAAIRERVEQATPDSGKEESRREFQVAVGRMVEDLELAQRARELDGVGTYWSEGEAWFDGRDVLAASGNRAAHDAVRRAYLILEGPESNDEQLRAIREAIALLNPLLEGDT